MLERVRVAFVADVLIHTPRVFTEQYERPNFIKSYTRRKNPLLAFSSSI